MKPARLFKYEPFSARALQNLKEQVIYFGSPLNFNDPYDCALSPRIKDPTETDLAQLREHYLQDKRITEKVRSDFERMSDEALRSLILKSGAKAIAAGVSEFLSSRGVSCFSEINDSLLMWSHYGEQHKGFCLEFRTDRKPFDKVYQVNYADEIPEVDVLPILCNRDLSQIRSLYCIKAQDWKYEREWRGIHQKASTAYVYDSDALTGIYLGPEMPFSRLEIVALILKGQNEFVQLWQGRRSAETFKVEFDPITYTPHLEAKRNGLVR